MATTGEGGLVYNDLPDYVIFAVLLFYCLLYKPDYTRPGPIIVLLGLPDYFIWRRYA
jgi:hypothetical protein